MQNEVHLDIATEDDVFRLEETIRRALQCDGLVCTFLESLPYRTIRRSLLRRLRGVTTHDADISAYPHPYMSLHVKNARHITLRLQTAVTEATISTPKKNKLVVDSTRDEILRAVKRKRLG
jgi:hypothetical protein